MKLIILCVWAERAILGSAKTALIQFNVWGWIWAWKVKGKTHDLIHNLKFSAHTINCVRHSIRSMFRVLGIYNFAQGLEMWIQLGSKVPMWAGVFWLCHKRFTRSLSVTFWVILFGWTHPAAATHNGAKSYLYQYLYFHTHCDNIFFILFFSDKSKN